MASLHKNVITTGTYYEDPFNILEQYIPSIKKTFLGYNFRNTFISLSFTA